MDLLAYLAALSAMALLAVWAAYPLAIALIARFRHARPVVTETEEAAVSVIIATREDDDTVIDRVSNCLAAEYGGSLEVILVLDSSAASASTRTLQIPDDRVRVIRGDAPGGKATALNAGVRAAAGDILVFTDSHQRFRADAIRRLVAALADASFGAVSGSLELAAGTGTGSLIARYWRYERWLRRSESRVHSAVGVSGSIYALRKELWAPLPAGLILDDVWVPMRVVLRRLRVGFVDTACAYETRRTHPTQEYHRKVRTLTGVIQLCAWLPAVLTPVRNPVWVQFWFHKVLRLFTPYWLLVIALWLAIAGMGWLTVHPGLGIAIVIAVAASLAAARVTVLRLAREALLMQSAVIVATLHGVRGRWDVWRR